MAKRGSKVLVIDTSVAHAAGDNDAVHPTGTNCRDLLKAVKAICHRVAMPRELRIEWSNHASGFARAWLVQMKQRGKVKSDSPPEQPDLLQQAASAQASQNQVATIEKDWLLIEAALGSDRSIVSLDDTARDAFRTAAKEIAGLRKIVWVNPDKPAETPMEWLQRGAKPEEPRMLGAV
jgi:hypothetical protein